MKVAVCVISTPVILNGGYIYTFTLFKRGQSVCVCVRERSERRERKKNRSLFGSGFFWVYKA